MAKQPNSTTGADDSRVPKKRRGAGILGSILLGLIAMSMLGFGVTSFGGGASRIGKVGDQDISVNDYVSGLQAEVNRYSQLVGTQVPLRDLLAAGVGTQVLGNLVRSAALDGEMAQIGLSVGDTELAAELVKIAAFQGVDGQFDRAAYGDALRRNNLSESEFEAGLRADIARGLLTAAISGAAKPPAALTEALAAFAGETREIVYLPLAEADLPTPLLAPK
ncbi:MAG: SurA N-terminal domain-containing protein [Cypionkella sp.]|nr:SurA N-terminal domain-containing protein [Cypionkella sp.]